MRIVGIPVNSGDGPIHAVNRDEGKAVRVDFLGNFRDRHLGGDQLVLAWRVDTIETGMRGWWAGDPHVNFRRAGISHHGDDLSRSGAAYDGIIDKNDAFAAHRRRVGVVLQLHRVRAVFLCRLDEGPADIVVSDDPQIKGNAGCLGIAKRRGHT